MTDDAGQTYEDDAGQTYEEAIAFKDRVVDVSVLGGVQRWFHSVVDVPIQAQTFLNRPPAQGPGEASVTNRADGKVDVYWYLAKAE
jgi:hypothetical protein